MRYNPHSLPLMISLAAVILLVTTLPVAGEEAVAIVNGQTITKTRLVNALLARTGRLVLNQLIDETLIRQAAKKHNVTVSKQEVDEKVQTLRKKVEDAQARTGLDWVGWLAAQDVSEQVLRKALEVDLLVQKIVEPQVKVADEEVQQYYTSKKMELKQPAAVHVAIIAVETETEAKNLLKQIRDGADFATVAKEHSLDPTSKGNGGDIGWILKGPLAETAFKMTPGQVTGPITDNVEVNGTAKTYYFLVKLIEKRAEHIPTYEEAKEPIRKAMFDHQMSVKTAQWYANLRKKAKIEIKIDFAKLPG